jgi:hypothetical protein
MQRSGQRQECSRVLAATAISWKCAPTQNDQECHQLPINIAAAAAKKAYLLAEAKEPLSITKLHCFCFQVLWAEPAAADVSAVKHGQTRSTFDFLASARGAVQGCTSW